MSGSRLAQACEPAFARHETFHPRFGWLYKAVNLAGDDGAVFTAADATVQLGVGKNMVTAIRAWGLAFKVLELQPNPARPRLPLVVSSQFGRQLLGAEGWDPYLEDPASLWLLHWRLLSSPCLAPAWWVAFNDFPAVQFDEAALSSQIERLAEAAGWPPVVPSSVRKDVDCLIRTYTVRRTGRQGLDDLLDCPFRELSLLEPVEDRQGWRFVLGDKPTLPDALVAVAALEFAAATGTANSISVARLAHEPGGPGLAFRLPAASLFAALSRFARTWPSLRVAEPAGQRQLLFDGHPADLAALVLSNYYAASAARDEVPA